MYTCFCDRDMMSQCKAPSQESAMACFFYVKHSFANRCSHLNPDLNNHCWLPDAQAYGFNPEIPEEDYALVEDVNLVEMATENSKSCVDCILYTCAYVVGEHNAAVAKGGSGLNTQDLINIANNCQGYSDVKMLNASISQSLRGTLP